MVSNPSEWTAEQLKMAVERVADEAQRLRSSKERGPAFHAPWGQDIIDANNALADAIDVVLSALVSPHDPR